MEKTSAQFYTESASAWEAMLSACTEAKNTIEMEQYIFENDSIGGRFIEIFKQKQKAGVRVRLIYDTVGSYYFYKSPTVKELRRLGVQIRFFNIISPWRIHNIFSWYFRDHRKILVVDGKVGFTGGVGIREDMKYWRDTNVKVEGHVVEEMQNAFNEMWVLTAEKNIWQRIKRARLYQKKINFVTNTPYLRRKFLYKRVIEAIRFSKEYVFITTPYFIPNQKLIKVLRKAIRRGVDVRIIVPKTLDLSIVSRASHSFFYELLLHGVRIFQYNGNFIHTKTAVIDDKWSTVGSFNFDNLSFTYNHEANIISTEYGFINELKNHFENDLMKCQEVKIEEWIKRPIAWKIREFIIMPFRRFI